MGEVSAGDKQCEGNNSKVAKMLLVAVVIVIVSLLVISFMRYGARTPQSYAKTELKGVFTAQKIYFKEHGHYGNSFNEIGFVIDNDYAKEYAFGMGTQKSGNAGVENVAKLDELITTFDNTTSFKAYAVGNLDKDDTLDVWCIDHNNRLTNLVNDVSE